LRVLMLMICPSWLIFSQS